MHFKIKALEALEAIETRTPIIWAMIMIAYAILHVAETIKQTSKIK